MRVGDYVITGARRINDRLVELHVTNAKLERFKATVYRHQTTVDDLRRILPAIDSGARLRRKV